jgi:hypothetical protein
VVGYHTITSDSHGGKVFPDIGRTLKTDFGLCAPRAVLFIKLRGHRLGIHLQKEDQPQGWLGLLAILSHLWSHGGVILFYPLGL